MKKILILNGSNTSPEDSINWQLARRVAARFTRHEVYLTGLHEHSLPMYQPALEDALPAEVIRLGETVRSAAALVIVSPEHNGLMPACLKNAIDWLSRTREKGESFFGNDVKKILLLSTSPGKNGGATNLKYLGELMPWWGGEVVGSYSIGDFYQKYLNGSFDPDTEVALQELVAQFEARI